MHSIREFSTLYSHFQVTFAQMTSLPGHFRSPEVTFAHLRSRDVISRHVTASSGELKP